MRHPILRRVVALVFVLPTISAAQANCKPATDASTLPAVSALLDSANLVKNLPAPEMAASKEVFVRVTTGATPRAVVQDTVVAKTEASKVLVEKVLASLKPNAKNVLPAFRLRILLGEAPTVSVVPDLVCPPE